jgi:hypothetical protein
MRTGLPGHIATASVVFYRPDCNRKPLSLNCYVETASSHRPDAPVAPDLEIAMFDCPNACPAHAGTRHLVLRLSACVFGALANAAACAQTFTQTDSKTQAHAYEFDGWAVAVSGDWMLVGGINIGGNPGVVNVYQRNAQDRWDYFVSISSPDAANNDQFGAAVAMDGDTVVIGAPLATSGGNVNAGRAYIFRHTLIFDPFPPYAGHDAFVEVTELLAPTIDPGDQFGFSVALNGDTAVVGAPYASRRSGKSTYSAAGYASVHQRNAGTANAWGHTSTAVGDLDANDNFGYAVAVSGGNLLIGSPNARVTPAGTTYHSGRAYFFNVDANGVATYDHYVGTATPTDSRAFGAAVAIDSSVAAVGAPGAAGGYAASVDVFTADGGGGYPYTKQLVSPYSDTTPTDRFGAAVAVRGTQLVVGAPDETVLLSYPHAGQVYVYGRDTGSAGFWGLIQTLTLGSLSLENYYGVNGYIEYGSSVAYDGITLVGGGPLASYAANSTGAAFVFSNDPIFANGFDCKPSVICI